MAGIAAQAVVVLHLTYLSYVLLGGFLGFRDVRWLWPHVVTVVWGVVGVTWQRSCPLTGLEKHLRALDGGTPYAGTFIDRYLAGVLYPAEWQPAVWYASAVVVLISYTLTYALHSSVQAPLAP